MLCVFTSDRTSWTLGGFFVQLERHAPAVVATDEIVVFGYSVPDNLPNYAGFISLGKFEDYPPHRWSDGFLKALGWLDRRGYTHFWFMLDDYWLIRGSDTAGIDLLGDYMAGHYREVMKIDLAFDRLYNDPGRYAYYANHYGTVGHLDLIESPPASNYQMSLWGGIFSVPLLLEFIHPGWTAQEVELSGTPILAETGYKVLGTRQAPVLHTNVCHAGRYFQFFPRLPEDDYGALHRNGFVPEEIHRATQ